ncbi:hypothetical protein TrLO_g12672 [Triparma laevis f. longispina]|uniref:Uncharacterized protein n=1 Tax=Triparma laevis f. longispina TaxID=1714387 RepID=A0A9W7A7K3_9STRA|nr:hypothetical protein TrLO_g12672 [Triparma laevis f. longispina]
MMSADEMDETTIYAVGLTGVAASAGVVISEIYSSLKAQRRRFKQSESGQTDKRVTEIEEPVEECSWVFVGVTLLFTSIFSVLYIFYGVTLEDKNEHKARSEVETNRSSRGISTTELEEGMIMGAFV